MNIAKKMATSALAITGGAGFYVLSANVAEGSQMSDAEQSWEQGGVPEYDYFHHMRDDAILRDMENVMIEKALREYTNPLTRIQYDHEQQNEETTLTYQIKEGDTLSEIAVSFGIPVREIADQNNINNKHLIQVGHELTIRIQEKPHNVRFGETLIDIAENQGISIEDLLAHNQNLHDASTLFPGQEILVPTKEPEPVHQPFPNQTRDIRIASVEDEQTSLAVQDEEQQSSAQEKQEAVSLPFIWPLEGVLTSSFGVRWGRMHNGIDITHDNKSAPISAAQAGVVKDAYYNRGGYGHLVIIDHGGGYRTYYAHLREIHVQSGEMIEQGDVLGLMGSTGNSTGAHLHFEIRHHNEPLNPLNYLP